MEAAQFIDARSLDVLTDEDARLRKDYIALSSPSTSFSSAEDHLSLLQRSADFLETAVFLAALAEAVSDLGIGTVTEAAKYLDRIVELTEQISGYRANDIVANMPSRASGWTHSSQSVAGVDTVLIPIRSVLATCPIQALERLASNTSGETTGHRCRIAFDRLAAFVRRNLAPTDPRGKAIGRAYKESRFSLSEVADALEMDRSDALVFLDEHGYNRPIEKLRLTEGDRARAYEILRARRLGQTEQAPQLQRESIRRNVLASQRIEGIDARKWLADES